MSLRSLRLSSRSLRLKRSEALFSTGTGIIPIDGRNMKAATTDQRLRRIEGRHNTLVKELRRAFCRRRTDPRRLLRHRRPAHPGRSHTQRPAFSGGFLQRNRRRQGRTPALPTRRPGRDPAAARQAVCERRPQRSAAGSGRPGAVEGVFSGRRAVQSSGWTLAGDRRSAGPGKSGDDPAFGGGFRGRWRGAGRGHGQPVQSQSGSSIGGFACFGCR